MNHFQTSERPSRVFHCFLSGTVTANVQDSGRSVSSIPWVMTMSWNPSAKPCCPCDKNKEYTFIILSLWDWRALCYCRITKPIPTDTTLAGTLRSSHAHRCLSHPAACYNAILTKSASLYRIRYHVKLMPSPRLLLFISESEFRSRRGDVIGTLAKDPRYRKLSIPQISNTRFSKLFWKQLRTPRLGLQYCGSSRNKCVFWDFSS